MDTISIILENLSTLGIAPEHLSIWEETLPELQIEDQQNILLLLEEDSSIALELNKSIVSKKKALDDENIDAWSNALEADKNIPNSF